MSDANLVAEFLLNAQETAIESGQWRNIVYQGTNYPEQNPAAAGDSAFISRTEWSAWRNIPQANRIALFGDYGADSAKVEFKTGGGGFIIPHYRYCTMDGRWLVVRGTQGLAQKLAIKEVSGKIIQSGLFAGRDVSIADRYIADTSLGLTEGGSATTWRQMNTIRHITQVVSDLGEIYGYQIGKLAVQKSGAAT